MEPPEACCCEAAIDAETERYRRALFRIPGGYPCEGCGDGLAMEIEHTAGPFIERDQDRPDGDVVSAYDLVWDEGLDQWVVEPFVEPIVEEFLK